MPVLKTIWTPVNLSQAMARYKATELEQPDGSALEGWVDNVGGNHATSPKGSEPLFKTAEGSYVSFDGVNDYLTTPIAEEFGDFAFFIVFRLFYGEAYARLVDKGVSSGAWIGRYSVSAAVGGGVYNSTDPYGTYLTYGDGTWCAMLFQRNGTEHMVRLGNRTTLPRVNDALLDTTDLWIGASHGLANFGHIDIKELVVCRAGVVGDDLANLTEYALREYGLPLGGKLAQSSLMPIGSVALVKNPAQNVALAVVGGVATASSIYGGNAYPPAKVNDGFRHTQGAFYGWNSAGNPTPSLPEWVYVEFAHAYAISEVNVISLKDAINYSDEPFLGETFTLYGIYDFKTQYWQEDRWVDVDTVVGNNLVWNQFFWPGIITNKIRIYITAAAGGYARVIELEAYGRYVPTMLFTGAVVPAGALVSTMSFWRTWVGALSTTGAVSFTKSLFRSWTGTLTSWGSLTGITAGMLNLVGLVTPAATLTTVQSLFRNFTATVTPVAALNKVVSITKSGVLAASAVFVAIRAAILNLVGTLAPTGTLALLGVVIRNFVGTVSPSAVLNKLTSTAKVGSLASAGALIKTTAIRTFGLAWGMTGALAKRYVARITPTGLVTPASTLQQLIKKPMTARVTGVGSLLRSVAGAYELLLTGVLSATASLQRMAGKKATGTLTSHGALSAIRHFTLTLASALSPSGIFSWAVRGPMAFTIELAGSLMSRGSLTKRVALAFEGFVDRISSFASGKFISGDTPVAGEIEVDVKILTRLLTTESLARAIAIETQAITTRIRTSEVLANTMTVETRTASSLHVQVETV